MVRIVMGQFWLCWAAHNHVYVHQPDRPLMFVDGSNPVVSLVSPQVTRAVTLVSGGGSAPAGHAGVGLCLLVVLLIMSLRFILA